MNPLLPIGPISSSDTQNGAGLISTAKGGSGFGDLLSRGINDAESRVSRADQLLQAYARGDTVPIHQVTLALEQARVAVELAAQVRTRLVETYRDFMSMQL
jgi:Flagellar hook-basal body protein